MAQSADALTFRLPTTEGRDQLVYVPHRGERDGQHWMQIESPIAKLTDIDARRLLELTESTVVGGAAAVGGTAVFRHAAPLSDMTFAEFEAPFRLVTATADDLERQLTGGDGDEVWCS